LAEPPAIPVETGQLATRYRLLEAAARHIAERGPEGVSLRDIARDAGLTTGAIYRHFPGGKAELYAEILKIVAESVRKVLEQAFTSTCDPLEAVVSGCAASWDFFEKHPTFAALVVREGVSGGPASPYFAKNQASMALFKLFLESAAKNGQIRRVHPAHFAFNVGAYCLNFHGAPAMRHALFADDELGSARTRFLAHVRAMLTPKRP
jgi:AcrR family transcriptional regulator